MGEPHQIRLVHGTDEMKNKIYKTVAGYAVGDGKVIFILRIGGVKGVKMKQENLMKLAYGFVEISLWNLKLWFHNFPNILSEIILKRCSAYARSNKNMSYHGDKETLATLHTKCFSAYAF